MERLTERDFNFTGDFVKSHLQSWSIAQALKKLQEYENAEEDGSLLKLPCAVGATVYRICPKCNDNHDGSCKNCAWAGCASSCGCTIYGLWKDGQYQADKCTIVPYKASWNYIPELIKEIGKRVFLTREEAEAKLKEMKEQHG